jgi:hypothetical protein
MRKLDRIRMSWFRLRLRAIGIRQDIEAFPKRSANAMREALLEVGDGLLCPTPEAYAELEGARMWRTYSPWLTFATGGAVLLMWMGTSRKARA